MLKFLSKQPISIIITVSLGIITALWLFFSIKTGHFTINDLYSMVQLFVTILININTFLQLTDKWKVKQGIKYPSKNWKKYVKVVNDAHDWVDNNKENIRTQHELKLTFSKYIEDGINAIIIERVHKYCIHNPKADEPYFHELKFYTNLGTYKTLPELRMRKLRSIDQNEECDIDKLDKRGGFSCVKINDDTLLTGSALLLNADHDGFELAKSTDKTRIKFVKEKVEIPARGNVNLEFHSFGIYLLYDKLQLVFHEFCDGLTMEVVKKDKPKILRYKTNHHNIGMLIDSDNEKNKYNRLV
jgi:hypothetical protein